jgi:hypothetical protein
MGVELGIGFADFRDRFGIARLVALLEGDRMILLTAERRSMLAWLSRRRAEVYSIFDGCGLSVIAPSAALRSRMSAWAASSSAKRSAGESRGCGNGAAEAVTVRSPSSRDRAG